MSALGHKRESRGFLAMSALRLSVQASSPLLVQVELQESDVPSKSFEFFDFL